MNFPAFLSLKAKTSTVEDLSEALGELDVVRTEATRELERLQSMRPSLLVTATNDELEKHDAAMNRCRRDIEQAVARTAALEPEWRAADAMAEEVRRKSVYAKAKKARAEAAKALAEYPAAARALADILLRYQALCRQIGEANDALPEGAEPIAMVEDFNGRIAQRDRYEPTKTMAYVDTRTGEMLRGIVKANSPHVKRVEVNGPAMLVPFQPGIPHTPFLSRVALPGLRLDDPPFFPKRG